MFPYASDEELAEDRSARPLYSAALGCRHRVLRPIVGGPGTFRHHASAHDFKLAVKIGCKLCTLLYESFLDALLRRHPSRDQHELESAWFRQDEVFAKARADSPQILGTSGEPIGHFYLQIYSNTCLARDQDDDPHWTNGHTALIFRRDVCVETYPHDKPLIIGDPNSVYVPVQDFTTSQDYAYFILGANGPLNARLDTSQNLHAFSNETQQTYPAFSVGRFWGRSRMLPTPDFSVARSWINEYITHHKCGSSSQTERPSRLIRIRSINGSILASIIETQPLHYRYAYLSYTWAGAQQYTTTNENFLAHLKDLCVPLLPRLFQDTLRAAFELGYEYIWIDALCIIQNNDIDRETEIARMCEIYENAEIIISADAAKTPDEAFIYDRFDVETSKFCQLHYRDDTGSILDIINMWYYPHTDNIQSHDDPAPAHLDHRGWILQERFLSRRILHFGSEQMYFECSTHTALETLALPISLDARIQGSGRIIKANLDQRLLNRNDVFEQWRLLIQDYTARNLTNPKDKLRGISGLARWFSTNAQCKYLAGTWEEDMMASLLWYRDSLQPDHMKQIRSPTRLAKVTKYSRIAPTWSWASLVGNIAIKFLFGDDSARVASLIKVDTCPESHDVFGSLRSGTLTLRGKVKEALVTRQWNPKCHPHGFYAIEPIEDSFIVPKPGWYYEPDEDDDADSNCDCDLATQHGDTVTLKSLPCLVLLVFRYEKPRHEQSTALALVLTKVRDNPQYERLGIMGDYGVLSGDSDSAILKWFVVSEEKTVSIV